MNKWLAVSNFLDKTEIFLSGAERNYWNYFSAPLASPWPPLPVTGKVGNLSI